MATILVVDDDPAVLRLAATVLERAGHRVMRATNGLEALFVYESYASHLDLVLSDVDMPELDGLELAARIHAIHPNSRILLMSGCLPSRLETAAERLPLLNKPFLPQDLLAAVRNVFQGQVGQA
jgi:CheY-like chemotaxis protein